ncbi:MAG: hypothetical protein KY447_10350 [Actinobacteria bacterium]|nr:hypothetical protein [Actinomycetota bacterium]
MTGPTTTNRPPGGAPVSIYRRVGVWPLVGAVALVAAMVPIGRLLERPPVVDQVAFENPTRYDITIEVTDGQRHGWMSVGMARRQTTTTFEQVLDQGEVWIFRFSAQGEQGGEQELPRQQLQDEQWHVRIPDRVGQALRAKGASFPP